MTNINILREKFNLSQKELANRIGINDRSTFGKYERGKEKVPKKYIEKLVEMFSETPWYILDITELEYNNYYDKSTKIKPTKSTGDTSFNKKRIISQQSVGLKAKNLSPTNQFLQLFEKNWNNCAVNNYESFRFTNIQMPLQVKVPNVDMLEFVYSITDMSGAKLFNRTNTGHITINKKLVKFSKEVPEIEIFPLKTSIFTNVEIYNIALLYRFMAENNIDVLGGGLGSEIEDSSKLLNRLLIINHEQNLELLRMGIGASNPKVIQLAKKSLEASFYEITNDGDVIKKGFSGREKLFELDKKTRDSLQQVLISERSKKTLLLNENKKSEHLIKVQKYKLSKNYFDALLYGNYEDALKSLKAKYGSPTKPYFTEKAFKKAKINLKNQQFPLMSNTKNSRFLDEGLYIHHDKENTFPLLSNPEEAIRKDYKWQLPENLTYCNVLEHLALHVSIFREDKHGLLGINGIIEYELPEEANPSLLIARKHKYISRGKGVGQKVLEANEDLYFDLITELARLIIVQEKLTNKEKVYSLFEIMIGGLEEFIPEIREICENNLARIFPTIPFHSFSFQIYKDLLPFVGFHNMSYLTEERFCQLVSSLELNELDYQQPNRLLELKYLQLLNQ